MALVLVVVGEAADVVEDEFGLVHQGKPACGCVGEELVTKAAAEARYYLIFQLLITVKHELTTSSSDVYCAFRPKVLVDTAR
jgi:hypothetical protein